MANFIHIGEQSREDGISRQLGYEDITSQLLDEIVQDDRIRWIQINKNLPDRAYREIDRIFERRQDLYFRIFGIGTGENKPLTCRYSVRCRTCQGFDLAEILQKIKKLSILRICVSLRI